MTFDWGADTWPKRKYDGRLAYLEYEDGHREWDPDYNLPQQPGGTGGVTAPIINVNTGPNRPSGLPTLADLLKTPGAFQDGPGSVLVPITSGPSAGKWRAYEVNPYFGDLYNPGSVVTGSTSATPAVLYENIYDPKTHQITGQKIYDKALRLSGAGDLAALIMTTFRNGQPSVMNPGYKGSVPSSKSNAGAGLTDPTTGDFNAPSVAGQGGTASPGGGQLPIYGPGEIPQNATVATNLGALRDPRAGMTITPSGGIIGSEAGGAQGGLDAYGHPQGVSEASRYPGMFENAGVQEGYNTSSGGGGYGAYLGDVNSGTQRLLAARAQGGTVPNQGADLMRARQLGFSSVEEMILHEAENAAKVALARAQGTSSVAAQMGRGASASLLGSVQPVQQDLATQNSYANQLGIAGYANGAQITTRDPLGIFNLRDGRMMGMTSEFGQPERTSWDGDSINVDPMRRPVNPPRGFSSFGATPGSWAPGSPSAWAPGQMRRPTLPYRPVPIGPMPGETPQRRPMATLPAQPRDPMRPMMMAYGGGFEVDPTLSSNSWGTPTGSTSSFGTATGGGGTWSAPTSSTNTWSTSSPTSNWSPTSSSDILAQRQYDQLPDPGESPYTPPPPDIGILPGEGTPAPGGTQPPINPLPGETPQPTRDPLLPTPISTWQNQSPELAASARLARENRLASLTDYQEGIAGLPRLAGVDVPLYDVGNARGYQAPNGTRFNYPDIGSMISGVKEKLGLTPPGTEYDATRNALSAQLDQLNMTLRSMYPDLFSTRPGPPRVGDPLRPIYGPRRPADSPDTATRPQPVD